MVRSAVTYGSPILYICLAGYYIYYISSRKSNASRWVKPILKILPHLLMVWSIMYLFIRGPPDPEPVISPYYLLNLNSLLYVYLFTMIADVLCTFDSGLFYGVFYGCVAQWQMVSMFSEDFSMYQLMTSFEKISLTVFLLLTLSVYLYALPKVRMAMVVPTLVYCVLLAVCMWTASLHLQRLVTPCTIGATMGTLLLYGSWALAVVNKWRGPIHDGEVITMIVYYTAMFLISYCKVQAEFEQAVNKPKFNFKNPPS